MQPRLERRDAAWVAGVLLVAAVVYGGLVAAGFTDWDDNRFVTANPRLAAGGWSYVKAAFTRPQFEAYAPLHLLSYLVDRALWPGWAGGYHLVNLLLFAGALVTWFALARRFAPAPAAAAAVLALALHPLTVEPVAWISARKDLLALLFVGLVLLVEDRHAGARPRWAALALGAAALLSKVSAVCLPVLVFAHLRWLRGLPWRTAAVRALPYALGAAALAVATWLIFRGHQMIPPARPDGAAVDVLGTVAAYVGRTAAPDPSPIYPARAPLALAGAVLVGLALVAAAATWRRWPAAARQAAVAFLAAIAPVANLVPVVFRFADRYVLLAHAVLVPALAIALAAAWRRLAARPVARRAAAAACVLVLAAEAVVAVPVVHAWSGSRALWTRAARHRPGVLLVRAKLGEALRDAGDFDGAAAEYRAMLALAPADPRGYLGLFLSQARGFEAGGGGPPGTADRWYAALSPAFDDPGAFGRLLGEVEASGCKPCTATLLALGLRRWPLPADTLHRRADEARRRGDEATARVYEDALAVSAASR
ncbi:MAG TPA: hypothetical protein VHE35_25775 [Kofleriaceae bacterium]|nr:hypothetical protein [Kofleriaceae bacterium]